VPRQLPARLRVHGRPRGSARLSRWPVRPLAPLPWCARVRGGRRRARGPGRRRGPKRALRYVRGSARRSVRKAWILRLLHRREDDAHLHRRGAHRGIVVPWARRLPCRPRHEQSRLRRHHRRGRRSLRRTPAHHVCRRPQGGARVHRCERQPRKCRGERRGRRAARSRARGCWPLREPLREKT